MEDQLTAQGRKDPKPPTGPLNLEALLRRIQELEAENAKLRTPASVYINLDSGIIGYLAVDNEHHRRVNIVIVDELADDMIEFANPYVHVPAKMLKMLNDEIDGFYPENDETSTLLREQLKKKATKWAGLPAEKVKK